MGFYFMLWVIIQHYFIHFLLKVFQLWPLGVLVHWAPSDFLALQGAQGLSCVFVSPGLESAILPRRIDSVFVFVLRIALKNKICVLSVLVATRCYFFSILLANTAKNIRANINLCKFTHTYTEKNLSLYVKISILS